MSIEWTQYSAPSRLSPIAADAYRALRLLAPTELEHLIADIKSNRWSQFRLDHSRDVWCVACLPLGIVLAPLTPLFVFLALVGFIGSLSVFLSSLSFFIALVQEMKQFRRTFQLVQSAPCYEDYLRIHRLTLIQ